MYGCILIVGGGMKFIGIGNWLHNRIGLQIPYLYRSEQLDIVTSPKDMDSDITAWKGGAVMSCLVSQIYLLTFCFKLQRYFVFEQESASELWITNTEWQKGGVRILREKAPFMW